MERIDVELIKQGYMEEQLIEFYEADLFLYVPLRFLVTLYSFFRYLIYTGQK
jgi:hypothetical protein